MSVYTCQNSSCTLGSVHFFMYLNKKDSNLQCSKYLVNIYPPDRAMSGSLTLMKLLNPRIVLLGHFLWDSMNVSLAWGCWRWDWMWASMWWRWDWNPTWSDNTHNSCHEFKHLRNESSVLSQSSSTSQCTGFPWQRSLIEQMAKEVPVLELQLTSVLKKRRKK